MVGGGGQGSVIVTKRGGAENVEAILKGSIQCFRVVLNRSLKI